MALGPLIGKDKEEMWNALLLKVRPEETRLSITLPPDINFDLDDSDTDGRRGTIFHESPVHACMLY